MRMRRICISVSAALAVAIPLAGVGQASASQPGVPGLDEQYLMTSTAGDLFEIQGAKLALSKTSNPAVLALANTLKKDHHKSFVDSTKLAKQLGASSETKPEPSQRWELQILGTLTGSAFDHQYSLLEVQDHMQDIAESSYEAHHGANAAVRKSAKDEIPILKGHLKLSKKALEASP
jgi:putative membrane protein